MKRDWNKHGHHHGHSGKWQGFMGGGGRGFGAGRVLSSGELQLIVLLLLYEKPRHGYEIIKEIEVVSSGIYEPSPGVVYPALTYLEEMGFATSEANGNKRLFSITEAGKDNLEKNRAQVDETLEQLTRFGRKMARMQKHFADEEAEKEFDESDSRATEKQEWRNIKTEFRELREGIKAALWSKIDAPVEEKRRVLEILKRALSEIRASSGTSDTK